MAQELQSKGPVADLVEPEATLLIVTNRLPFESMAQRPTRGLEFGSFACDQPNAIRAYSPQNR